MFEPCLMRFRWILLVVLVVLPASVYAQDQTEINTLAVMGRELIAQQKEIAKAQAEAAHKAELEHASRLKQQYQDYLGQARRTAQKLIERKRREVTPETVEQLRTKARDIIDQVSDDTKRRVPEELDPVFAELEKAISLTPDELLAADKLLANARRGLVAAASREEMAWVDQSAILYAMCPNREEAAVIASNVQLRDQLSEDESLAINECNRRRLILGLQPLAIDMKLVECGRDHSSDMLNVGFFSHTSPVEGKTHFTDRAKNFGTRANGENIAAGYAGGIQVTMGWWYSPGHLKNMMNRGHKYIGVGQKNKHYTQLFRR